MATKKTETVEETKTTTLEEMQAQMAAMLAEAQAAKAEAARMLEEAAKMSAGKINSAERAAEIEADRLRGEEPVEVKLFKDTGKYKDDVFVAVNGENCVIKRGERVQIKRKFAEVLDHSEHQDYETSLMIEQKSREGAQALAEM